jgi:predicted metalloprotease with PDZ domain
MNLMTRIYFVSIVHLLFLTGTAQISHQGIGAIKNYDRLQPAISYTIKVDTTELSFIDVTMQLQQVPDHFELAMFAHPEYDDRYHRYVENLTVTGSGGAGTIELIEPAHWKVSTTGNEALVHYKIHLPAAEGQRAAWKPFLSTTGALIGGPHCYLYLVGATTTPVKLHLQLPVNWQVATSLEPTTDPFTYLAPSTEVLLDAPVLTGKLKTWSFTVHTVPHKVVYWGNTASPFDTAALILGIRKITEQAFLLFGKLPYKDYTFLLQDSSYGALEHANSVTLGAPASGLATNPDDYLSDIAHEYFHAWNIVRIRPEEYGEVSYKKPPYSKGLWWSEGLTMLYADLLQRRAGFSQNTRIEHLQHLIERFLSNSVYRKFSAEAISQAEYAPLGFLGDYNASTHLQGELLGNLLDFMIRDATDGHKNIDDLMRKMMEDFGNGKGFTGKDIEASSSHVCGCNVRSFFDDFVRGHTLIPFNAYLQKIGLKATVSWDSAKENKELLADLSIFVYQSPAQTAIRIGLNDAETCWGKAGLHNGDELLSINGSPINTASDFYSRIRTVRPGDSLEFQIKHSGIVMIKKIMVTGYLQPNVFIEEIKTATSKQKRLLEQWKKG